MEELDAVAQSPSNRLAEKLFDREKDIPPAHRALLLTAESLYQCKEEQTTSLFTQYAELLRDPHILNRANLSQREGEFVVSALKNLTRRKINRARGMAEPSVYELNDVDLALERLPGTVNVEITKKLVQLQTTPERGTDLGSNLLSMIEQECGSLHDQSLLASYVVEQIFENKHETESTFKQRELLKVYQQLNEVHKYLDFLYGNKATWHFLNTMVMSITQRRGSFLRDASEFMMRRVEREGSRLSDECAKYQVKVDYIPEIKERVIAKDNEVVLSGFVHAAVRAQLEYIEEFRQANPTAKVELANKKAYDIMLMVDESNVGVAQFELDRYAAMMTKISELKRKAIGRGNQGTVRASDDDAEALIAEERKLDEIISINVQLALGRVAWKPITLDAAERAQLHADCYKPTKARLESELYKEFYMPNGKPPTAIINFHTDEPSFKTQYDNYREDKTRWDVHDPYSLSSTAESDMNIVVHKHRGSGSVKFHHRIHGIPAVEIATDIFDKAARYLDWYDKPQLPNTEVELPQWSLPRESTAKFEPLQDQIQPLMECVVTRKYDKPLPKFVFDSDLKDREEQLRFSPTQAIQMAVALGNDAEYVHVQVNGVDNPFQPVDPRKTNLQSQVITFTPLKSAKNQEEVLRWSKETAHALKRARKFADTTLLASVVGGLENLLTPISPRFHPGIGPYLLGHGQISAPVIIRPDESQREKAKTCQVTCFETARPAVQTRSDEAFSLKRYGYEDGPIKGYYMDSIGVVGIVNDIVSGDYHVNVRLEPADVPQMWCGVADGLAKTENQQDNVREKMETLLKAWQKVCVGALDLEDYQKALQKAYQKMQGQIRKSITYQNKRFEISDAKSLQSYLNFRLQVQAEKIVDASTIDRGFMLMDRKLHRIGGANVKFD